MKSKSNKPLNSSSLKALHSYLFGQKGEKQAQKFLQKKGFRILFCNFSSKFGELDIVAQKGEILHFVEVKTSKNYESEYYLTEKKLEKINKTIMIFLASHEELQKYDYCIDLIAINDDKINFIENIYQ